MYIIYLYTYSYIPVILCLCMSFHMTVAHACLFESPMVRTSDVRNLISASTALQAVLSTKRAFQGSITPHPAALRAGKCV